MCVNLDVYSGITERKKGFYFILRDGHKGMGLINFLFIYIFFIVYDEFVIIKIMC